MGLMVRLHRSYWTFYENTDTQRGPTGNETATYLFVIELQRVRIDGLALEQQRLDGIQFDILREMATIGRLYQLQQTARKRGRQFAVLQIIGVFQRH